MWMSNVLIVVDKNNPDHNSLADLAEAVKLAGGENLSLDETSQLIEADMPTHEVVVAAAMDGISYIRSVFTYFKGDEGPTTEPQEPSEAA
jgi:hypothetical protein